MKTVNEAREALMSGVRKVALLYLDPIMEAADAYALAVHFNACAAGFIRTSSDPHGDQPKCSQDHPCGKAKKLEELGR